MIHKKLFNNLSTYSKRELYVQFLFRIYFEIPNCKIANFSTLKNLQSSYFIEFREIFRAKLESIFLVPAATFDNVSGKFPIGFFIWDSNKNKKFKNILADVFNFKGNYIGNKKIFSYSNEKYLNDWLRPTWPKVKNGIGFLACNGNDFQNQNGIYIEIKKKNKTSTYFKPIGLLNLQKSAIYYAVRHYIPATWLNDRDQFLYPNKDWKTDKEFQNDCLAYTLFNNDIQSEYGTNHWIPFTEQEVNAQGRFESHFMSDFINGKIKLENETNLFDETENLIFKRVFSEEAQAVFNEGRELWKYYHSKPFVNVNASLYDIKEYFQGRNDKGRMNSISDDKKYMELIRELRNNLNILAKKNKPKIYDYGFLKG